jgi:hypothetical protein
VSPLRRSALVVVVVLVVAAPAGAVVPHARPAVEFPDPAAPGVALDDVEAPAVVAPGATLPIRATVGNPTAEPRTATLRFTLVQTRGLDTLSLADARRVEVPLTALNLTLPPGSTGPVGGSASLAGVPPGDYALVGEFGRARTVGTLTVGSPFVVLDLDGPANVTPGTPFRANATVGNPNPFTSTQVVQPRIAGVDLRDRPARLPPNTATRYVVTFEPPAVAGETVEYGVYTAGASVVRTATLVDGPPAGSASDPPGVARPVSTDAVTVATRPAPPLDVVGWEDGHWYDDDLALTPADGFDDAEFAAYVARAKARTEFLREREMDDDVRLVVVPPDGIVVPGAEPPATPGEVALRNLGAEVVFHVGEDTPVNAGPVERGPVTTNGVVTTGFDGVLVRVATTDPSARVLGEATLVHEFVHVIQQQRVGDIVAPEQGLDRQTAYRAVSEGDAQFVEERFRERCRTDWDCVGVSDARFSETWNVANFTADDAAVYANRGQRVTSAVAYVEGQSFVATAYDAGGWDAVDALFTEHTAPATAEQVIHPERFPDDLPTAVPFPPPAAGNWSPFAVSRVGESGIFALFWYQAYTNRTDVVDPGTFFVPDGGRWDRYNYTSTPSDGWVNDRQLVYADGPPGANDTAYAYTWTSVWDDGRNATEFHDAYVAVLRGQNATRVGPGVWVIPDGPYADAFAVRREGATVTVVNAPTVAALAELDPNATAPLPA